MTVYGKKSKRKHEHEDFPISQDKEAFGYQARTSRSKESEEGQEIGMFYIYILQCSDRTLYTGFTNDLIKRVLTHNSTKSGAKYTRGRRPVKLVYSERFRTKSKAMKREWEIKRMRRKDKVKLIKYV